MVIIIICILLVIIGIVVTILEYRENVDSHYGLIIVAAGVIIPIFLGFTQYFPNLERKAYLESFYNSNANAFQVAADKTATYLSSDEFAKQLIAGSLEKQGLANIISQRIQEWRDAVVTYNQILQTYKLYKSNIWIGAFLPSLDDYLKPLKIQ